MQKYQLRAKIKRLFVALLPQREAPARITSFRPINESMVLLLCSCKVKRLHSVIYIPNYPHT